MLLAIPARHSNTDFKYIEEERKSRDWQKIQFSHKVHFQTVKSRWDHSSSMHRKLGNWQINQRQHWTLYIGQARYVHASSQESVSTMDNAHMCECKGQIMCNECVCFALERELCLVLTWIGLWAYLWILTSRTRCDWSILKAHVESFQWRHRDFGRSVYSGNIINKIGISCEN